METQLIPFSLLYAQTPLQEENLVASPTIIVQTSIDGKTIQDTEEDEE
ncbi:hypothetical protein KDH_12360 [Dictyobacter sp. S3.2.2.5]|uniref:Uncharacterized protein n=1 Tax=Dictyobacter halimunensis TaxID=3026934 RepID=A0ABQ6FMZ0_9CHLR|nr:hypothetical protein KDH_12360 [Dictyobacter sp. S3.2.2.5]